MERGDKERLNTDRRATLWGATTILNWSVLALLTQWAGGIPPFLLTAVCFAIAGVLAVLVFLAKGQGALLLAGLKQPVAAWVLGIGGLFGYHLFYFIAQQNAPAAEAGLISYLWPLLIVIFAGFLPGEKLRARHIVGGLCGFAGAVLLVGPDQFVLNGANSLGYSAALIAAFIWAGYSVLSRLLSQVPTAAVAWNCLGAAGLAGACHLLWEVQEWPDSANIWAVVLLGLGPVGSAFFTWDVGMKHGNVQLLGLLAYATPLFSTIVLVASGIAKPSTGLVIAALLICAGALIGSGQRFGRTAANACQ